MGETWIIAETRDDSIKPVTWELLGAARSVAGGDPVTAVVMGAGASSLAERIAAGGADQVLILDDPELAEYSPDGWATLIGRLVSERRPAVVLAAATSRGRELAPRVAAILDVALASDVIDLATDEGRLTVVRPIAAGKALARVRILTDPQMATIRPNTIPAAPGNGAATVETVAVTGYEPRAAVTATEASSSARPDVAEADIIVTGGRGMCAPEHFGLVETLADELSAAVGASRAVVDAGWRPHSEQVGQTGKTVSPTLYVACGVSGAVQHLAGMKTSKVIVAINKDPEAPIFSVADYGIVGDVFDVLPALADAARALKGS